MNKNGIEGRGLKSVRAAVARARAYAEEKGVPLTAERLAAELAVPVTTLTAYAQERHDPPQPVAELLREALAEATASVIEHAMMRGSSSNMHMMYLRQYAGYGAAADNGGHVTFQGEQEI